MSDDFAIVGIGETQAVRRSSKDVRELVVDACNLAIQDAGIDRSDIDGIVTDAGVMPTSVPHDWVAGQFGIESAFDAAISYGGTGNVCAPQLAGHALREGQAKYVLCYFGVDWGSRPGGPYAFHDLYPAKAAFEKPAGFNGQPSYFALLAQRYIFEYGLEPEDLGRIAVSQRDNSILTGRGQMMKPMDLTDYLAAPIASHPLRYPDCCLISDGAIAFVMTTAERAADGPKKPVFVRGVGFASESVTADAVFTQKPDLLSFPGVAKAVSTLEKSSGIRMSEIDFAEIYDCFSISVLLQLEDLGFCKKGEGGGFVREGNTLLRGVLPVNTHGGHLSYGYRLAGDHIIEAVRQLRGEAGATQVPNAHLGIVTGLSVPDYGVLLLGN